MAIVENFSDEVFGVLDPTSGIRGEADYTFARGTRYVATGRIANAATDNSGSMYRLVELPSNAILHPDTKIDLQGWGFAAATVGTDTDTDALLSSVTVSGLSAPSAPIAHGDAKWGKPLWQQLGMTEDPRTQIALSIHTVADAASAGAATFEIHWLGN